MAHTGRQWKLHFQEHQRKTNNPLSAYAMHILNKQHERGSISDAVDSIKSTNKGKMCQLFIKVSLINVSTPEYSN